MFTRVKLSFDDGPGPSTLALLEVLDRNGCNAIFFVLGANLERQPDLAVRILERGHALGNHGWSHARPDGLSGDALMQEVEATDALILAAYESARVPSPDVIPLRLPYGLQDGDPRLATLCRLGRPHVGWTMLVDDWQRSQPAPQVLTKAMLAHVDAQSDLGEEAVFCLHDGSRHREARPSTVAAVGLLFDALRARGQWA